MHFNVHFLEISYYHRVNALCTIIHSRVLNKYQETNIGMKHEETVLN